MAAPARERIRVHVLIDALGPGGAEALVADFAAAAPSAGIDISVGYLQERGGDPAAVRLRELGIEPRLVGVESLLRPRDLRAVRRQLEEVRPDVLHTHLGYADFLGGRAARSLGIPAVSTIHVLEWEPGLREAVKERLMKWARRRAMSRVIAVSDSARERFLAGGWDTPERVVTVRNGTAGEPRAGAGAAVRAELGIAPQAPLVGMIGVLRPGKGHGEAARAVAALRERFPGLRLLVAGEGHGRAAVEDTMRPLGEAAVMCGWRQDVMEVLDALDVLIHPSHKDAFPTVLLEAMAASVPIVATAVGGIPEIVDDGVTGVLIDSPPDPSELAEAIGSLLADPGRRRRLGDAARRRFGAEFTAERWAERMRLLYEEVIAAWPVRAAARSPLPSAAQPGPR